MYCCCCVIILLLFATKLIHELAVVPVAVTYPCFHILVLLHVPMSASGLAQRQPSHACSPCMNDAPRAFVAMQPLICKLAMRLSLDA